MKPGTVVFAVMNDLKKLEKLKKVLTMVNFSDKIIFADALRESESAIEKTHGYVVFRTLITEQ